MRNLLFAAAFTLIAQDAAFGQAQPLPQGPIYPDRPLSQPAVSWNDPGPAAPAAATGLLMQAPTNNNSERVWAEVDYLMWFIKPVCLKPATLTTGSPADAVPGALGQPNTNVVMGDHKFEFGPLSGVRPTFGLWLDSDKSFGVEADGFLMQQGAVKIAFNSTNGSPASFIPFQSPQGAQQALPFSIPGVVNGNAMAEGNSWLWGTEFNLSSGFTANRGDFAFRARHALRRALPGPARQGEPFQ